MADNLLTLFDQCDEVFQNQCRQMLQISLIIMLKKKFDKHFWLSKTVEKWW